MPDQDTTPVMTNGMICSVYGKTISSIHRPGELQPAVVLPTLVQVQLLDHLLHEMLRHVVLVVPDHQEQRPRHLLRQLAVQVAAAESPNPPPCCSHGQHEDLDSGETVRHKKYNSMKCFELTWEPKGCLDHCHGSPT